jgi:hypothetical protein
MNLLDATLLVGSAAIGLGLLELSHRTLFHGQIWILDRVVRSDLIRSMHASPTCEEMYRDCQDRAASG